MASALGTSGWTHVDARWMPRSRKQSLKKGNSRHHAFLQGHNTSNAKDCVQATQVVLRKKWRRMEMEMDSHGGLEATIRQTESKKKTTQQLRETDP